MEDGGKRTRIIRAAIDLFLQKGFDAASVQEIAQAADVAKGTMYLYFPSKDQLIDEVFAYCHARNVEACDAGLDEEPTPLAKMQRRMRNAIHWAVEHIDESSVEQMYMGAPGRSGWRRYSQQGHFESVDKIVREGIESGAFKDIPSPMLGEVFFGIGGAFYFYFRENPEDIGNEKLWRYCMQMVKDCLLK